jgi:hypothetical protein
MKPHFLHLATHHTFTRRQHSEILAGILLAGWGTNETATGRYVTDEEMRGVLVGSDDEFRTQVLWQLARFAGGGKNHWPKDAVVFLEQVWPRQWAAKSPSVSARLAELAFANPKNFPRYVDCVLPLVVPIEKDHFSIPSLHKSKMNIVDKHPERTLALLFAILPEDARKWPYGTDGTITRIGTADRALLSDERLIELNRRWNAR